MKLAELPTRRTVMGTEKATPKARLSWICRIVGFALRNQHRGHRWEKSRYANWVAARVDPTGEYDVYKCTRKNCRAYWFKNQPNCPDHE